MENILNWQGKHKKRPFSTVAFLLLSIGIIGLGLAGAVGLATGLYLEQAVWALARLGFRLIPLPFWLFPVLIIALWVVVLRRVWAEPKQRSF